MSKKVAVLVVNPVNGLGLFQYLEAFFENGISYKTFAVSDSKEVKTNSGICMQTDDVVAHLKGQEGAFDALVFACGDAIPKLNENLGKPYYQDLFSILKTFNEKGKIMVGHCAAALLFDQAGIGEGKKVAGHPYVKSAIKKAIATDAKSEINDNLYTAQTENAIWTMMPELLNALK